MRQFVFYCACCRVAIILLHASACHYRVQDWSIRIDPAFGTEVVNQRGRLARYSFVVASQLIMRRLQT
jgi:hypothetical protein